MDRRSRTEAGEVWVILPTYCEAANVVSVISMVRSAMPAAEILVVDDASPDGTADIVAKLASSDTKVNLLNRPSKTGLGAAYLEAFAHVLGRGADVVITMDCDRSHDPADIPRLVEKTTEAGCVVGSRYVAEGRIENWPAYRLALSSAANRFVRMLFNVPVADLTSGFRAYRAEVVRAIVDSVPRSQGYSFQVEAVRTAYKSGLGVAEIPIRFTERTAGHSKMGVREVAMGAFRLTTLWLDKHRAPSAAVCDEKARN